MHSVPLPPRSAALPPPARSARRRVGLAALLPLLATFPLLYCGGRDRVSASPVAISVGARDATLDEFERAFWDYLKADSTLPADSTSRNRFVPVYEETLLEDAVAEEAVPVLEDGPRDRLDDFRERTMVDHLRKSVYGDAYKASDAELKRAYDLLGRKLHLRYMFLKERSEADQILASLREGAVFAKVAEQRSLDSSSRAAGGDIGWVTYLELGPDARDRVFNAKPGDLVGPFPWNGGYQIFKLEEAGENTDRGPFERERRRLEIGIVGQRVFQAQTKYQDDLLRKYHFTLDPAEITWMTVLLREKTASVHRGLPDPAKEKQEDKLPWTTAPVAPADTGRVLARFDPPEGRVTPLLVIDQLMTDAPMAWPTFENTSDVEKLIRALVLERLEIREALARGMDKDPDVVRQVTEQEREIRRRVWTRTVVRPEARPSDEEVESYYLAHRDQFSHPEQRRFVALNSAHRENAERAAQELRAGKTVEEISAELSAADTTIKATTSSGTNLLTYGQSPMLDAVLFKLPLNGVSDPIPVRETFTVAKVVEIVPASEDPPEQARNDIRATIVASRLDEARKQVAEEARSKYPVVIHWDVIRSARLTPPPGED